MFYTPLIFRIRGVENQRESRLAQQVHRLAEVLGVELRELRDVVVQNLEQNFLYDAQKANFEALQAVRN